MNRNRRFKAIAKGTLLPYGLFGLLLGGCGDNGFTPPVPHEFAYSHAMGSKQTGCEDCRITFETVLRSDPFYISDINLDREPNWNANGLVWGDQAGIIRLKPEEADFQKCLIITFHNPGPGLDGPYIMADVRVRDMAFFGLNDNELFIELIGENGDDGLFITGLIEGVELHFVTVQ